MPHTPSAKKRVRQNARRRLQNRAGKAETKTLAKRVLAAVEAGDRALAETELKRAQSKLDKIAKRRILHPNTAARKKSQLAKAVVALRAAKS
ncbi:MAG TPA: 30S ribosomal protein S20 [Planctomycetota bacterium]|jgi:small subunit ribosomal protein S20|nr:30S ribosomal protein S20 [Planctomycetota bacterium]OQC22401.1 MAG: 30S ribosomal protein S20 [Planctomycetes bacterium ADurb.Bin069]NMD34606.1 30S ribosomal protein S20 [Planctomycetota bacterium]HNR98864.1 30S ribosomal protein S20 [Planctomycetota bacterium]HNU26651.1 30S ribosomal protein S20 [Planctomycetota bacterium]